MKKGLNNDGVTLTLLLILTMIFKDKYLYLAPSLAISISILPYALTFLIPILIFNKQKIKLAKNALLTSALGVIAFYLIATILCSVSSNLDTALVDTTLRSIFTPYSINLGQIIVHYPDLTIFVLLGVYLLSHYILIAVYDAIKNTNTYLAFGIAVFTAFIIDTMLMVPFMHINDIYLTVTSLTDIIKYLTAAFIIVILTSTLLILGSPIFIKEKNNI